MKFFASGFDENVAELNGFGQATVTSETSVGV